MTIVRLARRFAARRLRRRHSVCHDDLQRGPCCVDRSRVVFARPATGDVMATKTASKREPWDKPNPKDGKATHHLTPSEKASAKRSAKKAGRPYPNLVDNMHAASKGKKK